MEETERSVKLAELGSLLQEQRRSRGLTEETVASHLKITARLVRAIEEGDVTALPHAVYARGFIRAYAQLVAVDAALVRDACALLKDPEEELREQESLVAPAAASRQGAGIPWFAIVLGLLFLSGGAWYFRDALGLLSAKAPESVQEDVNVTRAPVQPLNTTLAPSSATSAPTAAAPTPTPSTSAASTGGTPVAPASEEPVMLGGTLVSPAGETTPTAEQAALPAEGHRVVLTGLADCWMAVTADGKTSQRVLTKDEVFTIDFKDTFSMKLGNAGGIRVTYDGRELAPVGKPGRVKTVHFPKDADKF